MILKELTTITGLDVWIGLVEDGRAENPDYPRFRVDQFQLNKIDRTQRNGEMFHLSSVTQFAYPPAERTWRITGCRFFINKIFMVEGTTRRYWVEKGIIVMFSPGDISLSLDRRAYERVWTSQFNPRTLIAV